MGSFLGNLKQEVQQALETEACFYEKTAAVPLYLPAPPSSEGHRMEGVTEQA